MTRNRAKKSWGKHKEIKDKWFVLSVAVFRILIHKMERFFRTVLVLSVSRLHQSSLMESSQSFSNIYLIRPLEINENVLSLISERYKLAKLYQVNDFTYAFADQSDDSKKFNFKLHQQLKNDPLIFSFEQESTVPRELRVENERIYIEDPAYIQGYQDWYLDRMEIPGAWERCFTGQGVVIGVVDRGVNKDHPDLKQNYDSSIDVDVQKNLDTAQPSSENEVHGTNSAGVIAASRNTFCGIGIAFEATITGIKLFGSKSLTDSMEAQALSHKLNKIDIYSNSWGPPGSAQTISPLGILTQEAVRKGLKEGRQGKGAIYVFAAGNGGIYQDSCAYDGYVNDIGTIAVTAVHKNGRMLQSSERCSAIFVSAYSRSKQDPDPIVTTTDMGSKCTGQFGRSSAAAPQVSAIIALALQANPDLTWRDVQHLLVRSSEHNRRLRYFEEQTIINGADFTVSPAFGFGLVQGNKMVELAAKWKNVSPMKTCKIIFRNGGARKVPDEFSRFVSEEDCTSVRHLEHVEVTVDLKYCVRGYARVIVTSPFGTRSVVMPGRVEDSRSTILKWTSDTVHFWGENPYGTWKINIEPLVGGKIKCRGTGMLYKLSLNIHGSYERPGEYKFSPQRQYCPIRKVNWVGLGADLGNLLPGKYPTQEASKYRKLKNNYYDLENKFESLLYEIKLLLQKEKQEKQKDISTSQFSTVSPGVSRENCFENAIEHSLLEAGRGLTTPQLGITSIETCKQVCLEDDRCKSITFISDMRQRNRAGIWEEVGDKCFTNFIRAKNSLLKTPPDYIKGNFKIYNRCL